MIRTSIFSYLFSAPDFLKNSHYIPIAALWLSDLALEIRVFR